MSESVKTSGNRVSWLKAVSALIMDGGDKPPSIDRLIGAASKRVTTAENDGWVTARENKLDPDDYKAGWRIIVEEIVELLTKKGLVENGGDGLRWTGPQTGDMYVTWGGRKMMIQQADSRQRSRDRYMTELTLQGRAHLDKVAILGPRGGVEKKQLEVHPLAIALPQMTEAELIELRRDVEEHGVRQALILFEGKVLDGRHRLYIASVTGKPVRVEEFEGSEDEARALVASLNFARRHLTAAQKALSIERLFGEKARQEAKEAQVRKPEPADSVRANLPTQTVSKSDPERWENRAVKMAPGGAGVSARSVRHMAEVAKAPETLAKVERGEIRTVSQAAREAAAERGTPKPPKNLWNESIKVGLSRARTNLNNVLDELDLLSTKAGPGELNELLDDIEQAARKIRAALAERDLK
jgi:hypothetical protein